MIAAAAWLIATPALAAVKKVPYPEVTVEIAAAQLPEASFGPFWRAFSDAVKSRNAAALLALVGPGFVWTSQGAITAEFDPARDALHNFKVVFGFRQHGRDEDGGVENGPYWEELAQFAADPVFYSASDKTSLICGPLLAEVTDAAVFEQARKSIESGDDSGSWYFTAGETAVARAPGDTGAPVGKLGKVAFPVIGVHPPAREGAVAPIPTHYEVLLPAGTTGWIAASAAGSLANNRLCYAKSKEGRWMIGVLDRARTRIEGAILLPRRRASGCDVIVTMPRVDPSPKGRVDGGRREAAAGWGSIREREPTVCSLRSTGYWEGWRRRRRGGAAQVRDQTLRNLGYRVLRFGNFEVDREFDGVSRR